MSHNIIKTKIMNNLLIVIMASITVLLTLSCAKQDSDFRNNTFKNEINNYFKYLDSLKKYDSLIYNENSEYIFIKAKQYSDTTEFLLYLSGGAYDFLNETNNIIDFFIYNGYHILLIGDFPNKILNNKLNKKIDIIDDVVKKRFPKEYKKYLKDKYSVGPLIYDYMNLTLVYKDTTLVNCKREYY